MFGENTVCLASPISSMSPWALAWATKLGSNLFALGKVKSFVYPCFITGLRSCLKAFSILGPMNTPILRPSPFSILYILS